MSVFDLASGTLQPAKLAGNGTGNGHPADLVARQEQLNAATLEAMKNEPPIVRVFVTAMAKSVQEVYPGEVRDVTMKKSGFKLPRGVDSTGKFPPLDVYEVWFYLERHPHTLPLQGTSVDHHNYFAKWGKLLKLWEEVQASTADTPDCNLLMDASLHTMEGDMNLRLLIGAKRYPPYIQRYANYRQGEYCDSRIKSITKSDVQTYETLVVASRLIDIIRVRERDTIRMREEFFKGGGHLSRALADISPIRALETVITDIVRLFTSLNDQAQVEFLLAPMGNDYVLRASNLSSVSLPAVAYVREKYATYATGASYGLEKHFNTLDQVAPLPPSHASGNGHSGGRPQADVPSIDADSLEVHCTHSMYVDFRLQLYSQEMLSMFDVMASKKAAQAKTDPQVSPAPSSPSNGHSKKRTREEMEKQPSQSSLEDSEEGTMIEDVITQGPLKRIKLN